jgi:hypothetical protein
MQDRTVKLSAVDRSWIFLPLDGRAGGKEAYWRIPLVLPGLYMKGYFHMQRLPL